MRHVVFVAPRFLENTNRYVAAFASLEGLKLSVISEDPESAIPAALQGRIAGHFQGSITASTASSSPRRRRRSTCTSAPWIGMTGALEQLQMPMAEARDAVGIAGMAWRARAASATRIG
jgi:hypothetical protein